MQRDTKLNITLLKATSNDAKCPCNMFNLMRQDFTTPSQQNLCVTQQMQQLQQGTSF